MEILKQTTLTNRILNVLILLFFATPFLFIVYGQLQAGAIGVEFEEILASNPQVNMLFLTSFITPFIGYYLLRIKETIKEGSHIGKVKVDIIAISFSFLLMGNITYAMFTLVLLYFLLHENKISFKTFIAALKINKVKNYVAPLVAMGTTAIIRMMLILIG